MCVCVPCEAQGGGAWLPKTASGGGAAVDREEVNDGERVKNEEKKLREEDTFPGNSVRGGDPPVASGA